jgi:hypothetical protein
MVMRHGIYTLLSALASGLPSMESESWRRDLIKSWLEEQSIPLFLELERLKKLVPIPQRVLIARDGQAETWTEPTTVHGADRVGSIMRAGLTWALCGIRFRSLSRANWSQISINCRFAILMWGQMLVVHADLADAILAVFLWRFFSTT